MDAADGRWIVLSDKRGDAGTPVAALCGEFPISKNPGHQIVQAGCDVLKSKPFLSRLEGKPVSGQRRSDDGKSVVWIAAKSRRIGQSRNNVEEFKHRARPTVHEQEWVWIRANTADVQKMQVDVLQWHLELREFIQRCFLSAPVETVL